MILASSPRMRRPDDAAHDTDTTSSSMAHRRGRINWTRLSIACVSLGVIATAVGFIVVQRGSLVPIEQVLDVVTPASEVAVRDIAAPTPTIVRATTQTLLQVTPHLTTIEANQSPHLGEAAPTPTETTLVPSTNSATDTPSGPSATLNVAPATVEPVQTTEQPPGAELGFTYCGMLTCNVGFKCCCSTCIAGDEACEPSACEAYAGLSVSVPCGMDLCDSGEVCCDPRCGACARAGECPEEPCD